MADVQHRAALLIGGGTHPVQALVLEGHIPHRQHLVHNHNFTGEMGGHGEGQLHVHAGGITLHRGVDKLPDLGEVDDLLHAAVNLGPGHAQNGAVHIDVFPACQLAVEAGAHLQHGGHPAVDVDIPLGGGGDAAQQLEQGGLPRAVGADDAQALTGLHRQVHAVQGIEDVAGGRMLADAAVRVLPAPLSGPPGLKVRLEGAPADGAQAVFLFHALHADGIGDGCHGGHLL